MKRILLGLRSPRERGGDGERRHVPRASDGAGQPAERRGPEPAGQISAPEPISAPPAVPQALNFPQLVALWQGAGSAYGIPWQVLASINKIESNFGPQHGPELGWRGRLDAVHAEHLGAVGRRRERRWVADPWNPQDAIYAASRYLAASGGAQDLPRAVLSYNHAQWYVDEVLQLAHTFGSGGADTTFTLDRLQVSLDGARAEVAKANRELVAALKVQRDWAKRERLAQARADGVQLLSKQLELQKEATQVGVREHQAEVRVAELRARLTEATAALTKARTQAQSAASAPAPVAGALFASPVLERFRFTSSRSGEGRPSSRSRTTITTTRPRTSRRPRGRRSTRCRMRSCSGRGASPTRAAASASHSGRATARNGRIATSRTSILKSRRARS
jgi:hypothetical protein